MFALRGIAVSLTCFVLLYCVLSALVAAAWRALKPSDVAQRSVAALLFGLRILPLLASVVVTFAFVVPSFQLLEPRSIAMNGRESIGAMPLALGLCALLLIVWSCFRVIAAQTGATRVVTRWLEGSRPLAATARTLMLQSKLEAPAITLVGVHKPKVLVSEATIALLTPDELQLALKHELAHMQSHDNLKKLIFRFCPFPGMAKLESAWSEASELAADDAAVSSQSDAVDLAAALVKLSRLAPVEAAPVCAVGFVTDSLSERVARLLAWDEASKARRVRIRTWFVIPPVVAASLFVTVAYGPALTLTHEVTEWLVR
jgi:beta-lactamase regulating signal transducer with metallopeptidase domain